MPIVRNGGAELDIEIVGRGRDVLLIGGMGMPRSIWKDSGFVDDLVELGCRVIYYSSRGVAPSSAPPPPYSIDDLADDAAAIMRDLDVTDALVIGYSMGSYTAQALTERELARISGVALITGIRPSTISDMVNDMELDLIAKLGEVPASAMALEQMLTTLPLSSLQDDQAAAVWRGIFENASSVWAAPHGLEGQLHASKSYRHNIERFDTHLQTLTIPLLIVAFEHDLFFPPQSCEAVASLIPHAQFEMIEGAAHGGLFLNGEQTRRVITRFCTSIIGQQ